MTRKTRKVEEEPDNKTASDVEHFGGNSGAEDHGLSDYGDMVEGGDEEEWGGVTGGQAEIEEEHRPDAADLFMSGSFKLQIDALLPNVRSKASRIPPLDRFLLSLHTFLMGIPSVSPQHPLEAARKLLKKGVAVPYSLPLPTEDTNWKVAFDSPSDITLAGSWANKVSVKLKDGLKFGVDLAVELPNSLFQEKDYLNGRFFHKRSCYLAIIAAAIQSPKSGFNVEPRSAPIQTTLGSGFTSTALMSSLGPLVSRGLGDRVQAAAILHPFPAARPVSQAHPFVLDVIVVGLVLDPQNAFRLVNHGPAADDEDQVALNTFRELWGDKSELRRFKDGRIIDSVVWEVKTADERAHIPAMLVQHTLKCHFGLEEDALQTWQSSFDSVLRLPESLSSKYLASGVSTGFKGALTAFDNLVKAIKALDDELPLTLPTVSPTRVTATIWRARDPTAPRIASINADGHISKCDLEKAIDAIPFGWLTAPCVAHHPNCDQRKQALLTSLPRAPRRPTERSLLVHGRSTPSHPIMPPHEVDYLRQYNSIIEFRSESTNPRALSFSPYKVSVQCYACTQVPTNRDTWQQFTYPDTMYGGPQQSAFVNTIFGLTGINHYKDLNGGTPNCVSITPFMMNWRDGDNRSSSATAYLSPVESQRTNWITLTNHFVTKINWSNSILPLRAVGVEFAPATGCSTSYTALARKEVILAAGPLGITTRINLKAVGKGLQALTTHGPRGNGFDVGGRGPPNVIAFPNLYQVMSSQANATVTHIQQSIPSWAASQAGSGLSAAALQQIFQVQTNLIIGNNAPVMGLFYDTGYPGSLSTGESRLAGAVPDGPDRGSDQAWRSWIQQGNFDSVYHPVGAPAMMRRSLGGSLSPSFPFYAPELGGPIPIGTAESV
ncbi:GMC oxidoreductase [Laccaria amethystina LaAM-08-1]|uniref:U3 small nucleolar RNA-associated protein 22 n=1 Tax=Laccaria amethystina LaAM-08-1 TaxID=1095629 RepID=A0A0C9WV94_9AGAR|nr:GMC oxidoreductase [Laccaria amethystina LaAM-08-1]